MVRLISNLAIIYTFISTHESAHTRGKRESPSLLTITATAELGLAISSRWWAIEPVAIDYFESRVVLTTTWDGSTTRVRMKEIIVIKNETTNDIDSVWGEAAVSRVWSIAKKKKKFNSRNRAFYWDRNDNDEIQICIKFPLLAPAALPLPYVHHKSKAEQKYFKLYKSSIRLFLTAQQQQTSHMCFRFESKLYRGISRVWSFHWGKPRVSRCWI